MSILPSTARWIAVVSVDRKKGSGFDDICYQFFLPWNWLLAVRKFCGVMQKEAATLGEGITE